MNLLKMNSKIIFVLVFVINVIICDSINTKSTPIISSESPEEILFKLNSTFELKCDAYDEYNPDSLLR